MLNLREKTMIMDNAAYIYDLMTGTINRNELPSPVNAIIPEDPFFEKTMDEIYETRFHLSEKLGMKPDECNELQIIMDEYSDLCRYLSKKMFTYGMMLGSKGILPLT